MNFSFDSISLSAKSLLLTKALTTIPFAREASGLIWDEKSIEDTEKQLSSIGFLMRLIHFEKRYRSIDQALVKINAKNILEFSSGFSFRGLDLCKDPEICYVDTDLPQMIEIKNSIVQELKQKFCQYPTENFFLEGLNVLDENAFIEIMKHFSPGPITMLNEGLLVYLNEEQKRKLCTIIHNILNKKGGYWITADIYVKNETQDTIMNGFYDKKGKRFLTEHSVNENKFESFKVAELFFRDCGFDIYEKIEIPTRQLSSFKFLRNILRHELEDLKERKKVRETWILKPNPG